jgi:hypothetical protein
MEQLEYLQMGSKKNVGTKWWEESTMRAHYCYNFKQELHSYPLLGEIRNLFIINLVWIVMDEITIPGEFLTYNH